MNWLRRLFSRRKLYADLSLEMQEHLEERTAELIATGLSPDEAQSAARREFGNAALLEEHSREVWQWTTIENILRDFRFAARQLRRNPGFTLTVVLTLTLAIGANTTVFTMVNALLIRPLPYPHPERLAALTRHLAGVLPNGRPIDESDDSQDGETWELLRDNVSAVQAAAYSFDSSGVNLEADSRVRYVQDHRVSSAYFEVLGIKPFLGRIFTAEEDLPKGPNAAILSYELWQTLFAGDRNILGQAIRLKGEPYTVVGVMSPHVQTTVQADLWTPIQPWRGGEGGGDNYQIVMRLRDGATWTQVNGQLQPLHPSMFDRLLKGAKIELVARPLQEDLAEAKLKPTLILMSAVALILLIAAANLAGLMLVRVTRRTSEIATRMALGAPRSAILRQAVMEPLILCLAGATLGADLAYFSLHSFASLFPSGLIPLGGLQLDGRVLGFTFLCMVGVGLLIALFPVIATRRVSIRPTLADRSRNAGAGSGRTRQILVASEVCLTLVLLAGSGLLIRTLLYLETSPSGFDSANVLTASASLDNSRYHDPVVFQRLVHDSLSAMQQIPGVESAAMGLSLPYERGLNDGFKVLDGPKAGTEMVSSSAYVTPDYFRALRIPLVAGRSFTDDDSSSAAPVAMVNVSFARKFLGTQDVVGLHLGFGKASATIVGVIGDVKKRPGASANAPLSTEAVYYVPYTQVDKPSLKIIHVWFEPSWLVRTHAPITGLPDAMQAAMTQIDPKLPFARFHSLSDLQSLALSQQRIEVLLLTVLAGLALLISVVGIFGLVSNMVAQRRREIGIRMALGCTLKQAMVHVAGSGMAAVGIGLTAGLLLAMVALRILKSELYGVKNLDPVTLAIVSLLMLFAALLASFAPTLRIARIDPASTLRTE